MSQQPPGQPPQGRPPQGQPPQGQPQPGQPQPGQPVQGAGVPEPEFNPEGLAYGQHLVDHGPGLSGQELAQRRVKLPAQISILYSSIYASLLILAVLGSVKTFMNTSDLLEMNRTTGPAGGKEARGAKAKRDAAKRKKEAEAREQVYQTARRVLFAFFGFGLVIYFTAITGQWSGVVAAYRMANLKSYRWALWGNIFSAIPFLSIYYLVIFLAVSELTNVGGSTIVLGSLIVFGILDFIRFCLSVLCMITLFTAAPRKYFEVK